MIMCGRNSWSWRVALGILAIALLPFGGHYFRNTIPPIEDLLLKDGLSKFRYGALLSASNMPGMISALVSGYAFDHSRRYVALSLASVVIGCVIAILGISYGRYGVSIAGMIVFGAGESSLVVAERTFLVHLFPEYITIGLGIGTGTTGLSKFIARSTAAYIALGSGDYLNALWVATATNLFAVAGVVIALSSPPPRQGELTPVPSHSALPLESSSLLESSTMVPLLAARRPSYLATRSFNASAEPDDEMPIASASLEARRRQMGSQWKQFTNAANLQLVAVIVLRMLSITALHLFHNISSQYFLQKYYITLEHAGFLGSIGSVLFMLPPFIAWIAHRWSIVQEMCTFGCALLVLAYSLLIFTETSPMHEMLIIALATAIIPIMTLAQVPAVVPTNIIGTTFGVIETTGSVSIVLMNAFIGFVADQNDGSYTFPVVILLGFACLSLLLALYLQFSIYKQNRATAAARAARRSF